MLTILYRVHTQWSYGITCWEVYSLGRTPYPTVPNHEILKYIDDGNRPPKPDLCSDVSLWCSFVHTLACFHLQTLCRVQKYFNHKKVLLRERKRHTDRRVASTRYADPAGGGGGYTPDGHPPAEGIPQVGAPLLGGYPRQEPHCRGGYPRREPHCLDLGWGTPPPGPGWGTPPLPGPGMGYPPPPPVSWMGYPPPTDVN